MCSDAFWANYVIEYAMCRAVHVGLEASEEVDAVLYVSYVVTNASWSSVYDIRVFTKDKNMKVQYIFCNYRVVVCLMEGNFQVGFLI